MTFPTLSRWRAFRAGLVVAASLLAFSGLSLLAQQPADLFRQLSFREIGGTHRGGRFVDFAVIESTPRIFYAANATGGLWKTENNGITFTQVFDSPTVGSLGSVAVAQSAPNTVYAGSGEANNSRSSYWGDGVYKSTNAGGTWANVGLKGSQHIGRLIVHPTDPNTVYAAALGGLYSQNEERGVYKTTDGGTTWTKSLAVKVDGKDIGAVDLAMDPKNPLVLYAATYDKVRKPWTFAEGGPGSGIYKTIDAGKTWTKLAGGLPAGLLGRIGISISRQDPLTIYAIIENVGMVDDAVRKCYADGFGGQGGSPTIMYRSNDAGKTWKQVAPSLAPPAPPAAPAAAAAARGAGGAGAAGAGGGAAAAAQAGRGAGGRGAAAPLGPEAGPCAAIHQAAAAARAAAAGGAGGGGGRGGGFDGGNPGYYYSQVRVDPNDKETLYVLSVGWSRSKDGGQTWQGMGFGGDNHALWIDPKDSSHMLLGYDHGLGVSYDSGATWFRPDNLPTAQYYAIGFDMAVPYHVFGGAQDNGCHMGLSSQRGGGAITISDWANVGCADGFYNEVGSDSRWLYNESQFGGLSRTDLLTGQSGGIAPKPQFTEPLRYNWSAPILVSPHNPDIVYHGAQVLFRSPMRGESWQIISPDLTVNDVARRGGGGNITYATLTTIDESPIVPGLLWVGTDDGNVQVSKDAGGTWTNVRDKIPGHPGFWVSRVIASNATAGTAYVTMTGYRNDDTRAFIWKTTDFGQTWASIAGNLPSEAINVVRESPRNGNVLFVGTDVGVHVTIDGGKSWTRLKGAALAAGGGGGRGGGGGGGGGGAAARPRGILPTVPVHDLKIHPRDRELIVGTHGRGIWIADISEIEEMTAPVLASDAHLFEIDPVIAWVTGVRNVTPTMNFSGVSRPTDMGISYYLKSEVAGDVKVRVYSGSRVIAEMDGAKAAGVNTVRWNLQMRREQIAGEAVPAGRGGGRGGGGGGGGRGGGAGAGAAPAPAPAAGGPTFTNIGPAPVGTYRVVLSVGGREYSQLGLIARDPGK